MKFNAEENKFTDLPLYDVKKGTKIALNNLFKIKVKVDEATFGNDNEA